MALMKSISGIRGIFGTDLNPENLARFTARRFCFTSKSAIRRSYVGFIFQIQVKRKGLRKKMCLKMTLLRKIATSPLKSTVSQCFLKLIV